MSSHIKLKSVKQLKKLENEYNETFQVICKKIRKEVKTEILKTKMDLIKLIAIDYNLDYNEIYHKYINTNKKILNEDIKKPLIKKNSDTILEQIIIKDNKYYQDKYGNIYNENGKIISTDKNILINS